MKTSKVQPPAANLPPNAGKGRVKGVPNKITKDLRQMVLGALADAGGRAYLKKQAADNPAAFMTLVGKCLPKEITGPDGSQLFPSEIRIIGVAGNAK